MPSAPTGRSPFVSAVVTTYQRADLLRAALEGLCAQTLARDDFEVVVVDDGSTDATREVCRSFEGRLPLRYSYQRNAGLAAARNHGIFLARGQVLLFLDDDDVADPGLLEAHATTHRRLPAPEVGVLGHTRLSPELEADPLMHFATQVSAFLFAYGGLHDGDVLDFSHFWGGRSSCKRSLLVRRGVFNPVFRFGCEDVELAWRLARHGFEVVYDARAVSTMVRGVGFDDFCRRLERQGRSSYVFSRLHPEDAVQRWAGVRGAGRVWRRVGPGYGLLLRSGRELDRVARGRLAAGFGLDATETSLLYQGYWTAFHAARVKGTVEMAAEMGQDLGAGAGDAAARGAPG